MCVWRLQNGYTGRFVLVIRVVAGDISGVETSPTCIVSSHERNKQYCVDKIRYDCWVHTGGLQVVVR